MVRVKTKNRKGAADSFRDSATTLVDDFRSRRPLRTGSLLISVFGDTIAPHGGVVWLGSLINVLGAFGINQRLVRTSVFRLVKEGWLASEQIGRRSYYNLTVEGRARFQDASRRIYGHPRPDWNGTWCLVLLGSVDSAHRDVIRKELSWLGFAPFSPNVMAHPSPDEQSVEDRLEQMPGNDEILIMQATANDNRAQHLQKQVHESWALQDLDDRYASFLEQFRPIYQAARHNSALPPELAFQVRTLLIHEYRKILLRDPALPAALLPERWNGRAAYQLCRNIYALVTAPTQLFLAEALENANGPLPPATASFYQRFGGLEACA